jgi:hypothetical protein
VRGVGESNFSGNGVEFDSVAAAVEHARGIFNSWGGCDAWAVIPVQVQPDQGGRWTPGLVAARRSLPAASGMRSRLQCIGGAVGFGSSGSQGILRLDGSTWIGRCGWWELGRWGA